MKLRYPRPLQPGERIGVTSPSSGVPDRLLGRLNVALDVVRARGYEVTVGTCMDGSGHVSASAADRAEELMRMLIDPTIRAVVPPWGGETAIDLVPLLDWERLKTAEPTWMVGYSDVATLTVPLTLLTGTATIHGNNLMDTPYRVTEGLLSWLDVAAAPQGGSFTQRPPGRYRTTGWDDYASHPDVREYNLDAQGTWTRLDGKGEVRATGRLIGGCIESLCNLAGTAFLDTSVLTGEDAADGLIVYVEAARADAFTICRHLHGMRLAGFFDHARAVLIGRTRAPDSVSLSQHEAVLDALGSLGVPLLADVECGHVPPHLSLVNGALAEVVYSPMRQEVTQILR
ncbi:S66 family peptidase [Streptomyces nigra]|uniref:S66 family peptidase n=1 Tax=Streptomyces nigra TaxID=1827580 RepID=UPI00381F58EB